MTQLDASRPNAKQREEWNDAAGRRWLEIHHAVDPQIAPFGRHAMDGARIRAGDRILDVGCGCGEATLELAHRVGKTGAVLGIDISRMLVDAARELAKASGLSNVRFEQADAQTHRFGPEAINVVFSRFGIMFFDNPTAAFRNLRAALRPGGKLAFVCWPAPQENQFITIPAAAAARHIEMPTPGDPGEPGPFAFADVDRVLRILTGSGFTDIGADRVVEKVGGGTVAETAELLLQVGPIGGMLGELDEKTKASIAADIEAALRPLENSGRAWLDATALLVTARAH